MKIITSHERADMDALASMYGAWILYPEHTPVLPSKINRNLRSYLALYGEALSFVEREALPREPITHVILVDTHAVAPLRGMDGHTVFHIIDHHLEGEAPTGTVKVEVEPVGATSTMLVEAIRARGLSLSPTGATLLLMGIYEDTGSLSYLTTTARDAKAAAFLLEQGADLKVANAFLRQPLAADQRQALARLLQATEVYNVRGRTICVAAVKLDSYVEELSALIHQLMDVYEPDACFLLAQFEGDVQVIARSATDAIDVAGLLRGLNGGGHSKAAAALVQGSDLEQITERLLKALQEQVRPPTPVTAIMSTNVHTVSPDMTVREAAGLMARYGHEGFPVVDGQHLVGLLTRSDVDRALHHRLGDMPVRSLIHSGPVFVGPSDPVEEVERVMIEHNLGQVPVVQDGQFVGIVTRTDVIKLHVGNANGQEAYSISKAMDEALPEPLCRLLIKARDVANDMGYSLYVVGGFVRDLLLGAPTLDLDLVVEGDAIAMAERLAEELGQRVRSHARFGTAKIVFHGPREPGVPRSLDFATARTEFYERPTELPQVERSSIKQDLYRRDFTINTMAICLDRGRYGELLDFYGGLRDLKQKRIRVLHNLSFIEDPTRILRAVRFEQRLGFQIEGRTEELMLDALSLLDDVSGDRLRTELYLILEEDEPERILDRLSRLGVLTCLSPQLQYTHHMGEMFVRLRERFGAEEPKPSLPLAYLALLTSRMSGDDLERFANRLHMRQRDRQLLQEVASLRERLPELGAQAVLPSRIYRILEHYTLEARFVVSVLTDSDLVRQRLDLYEHQLSKVSPSVDGHYLRELGIPSGPLYGEILDRLCDALLDGVVTTPEEEQAYVQRLAEAATKGSDEAYLADSKTPQQGY